VILWSVAFPGSVEDLKVNIKHKAIKKYIAILQDICYNNRMELRADSFAFKITLLRLSTILIFKGVFMWNENKTCRAEEHFQIV
jgi:hypothetical protein